MAKPQEKGKGKGGKEIKGLIKLTIMGGQATPAPPVGPACGQYGVNIMEFCTAFNAGTENDKGVPIPVIATVFGDGSFKLQFKKPPASHYIKQALKIKSGANAPGHETIAQIGTSKIREIAEQKMQDLNANDIEAAMKIIAGSARSMGIEVVEG